MFNRFILVRFEFSNADLVPVAFESDDDDTKISILSLSDDVVVFPWAFNCFIVEVDGLNNVIS
jgi:hypothetical protein